MPNTSFRVAFWALLISVGLCVVAASTNTRDARLALSYPARELSTPDDTLLAGQSDAVIKRGRPQDIPAVVSSANAESARTSSTELQGRVASLDPFPVANRPIRRPPDTRGPDVPVPDPYERSPLEPITPLVTAEPSAVGEPLEPVRPLLAAQTPTAQAPAEQHMSPAEPLPPWSGARLSPAPPAAPAPRAQVASSDPEQSLGKFPAWALQEAHGVYEELAPPPAESDVSESSAASDDAQLEALQRELATLKATQNALEKSALPGVAPHSNPINSQRVEQFGPPASDSVSVSEGRMVPGLAPMGRPDVESPATQSPPPQRHARTAPSIYRDGVSISAGTTVDRWHLNFQQATVRDVLMSVGEMIGWNVVIEPDVIGTFSGAFQDADLEQSFAVVVKANRLRVERRGDYILIGTRSSTGQQ